MTRRLLCRAVVVAVLLGGCRPRGDDAPARLDLARLLPVEPAAAGWRSVEGPLAYAPRDLYEVLDGGAERYLSYGFRQLLRLRLEQAGQPPAGVTLDLFDMGDELGAFGIYSVSRPGGIEPRPWGAEGYRWGAVAAAWKGSLFVHAEADDERPESLATLERLVVDACARAPGGTSPPRLLAALPPDGLVPRSERLVAADLLGLDFLPGGVLATYRVDGHEVRLFYSDLGSEAAAAAALAALRDHQADRGPVTPDALGAGFAFVDPVLGAGVATRSGRFVAGVHGGLPPDVQADLLRRLVEGLSRLPAPR